MKLKKYKVERYTQLPDKAGVTYDVIEEFKPKSYIQLEHGIRNFLNYSHKTIAEKQPPITAEMLVAPWGLGKTTTYDKMLIEQLKDDEFDGFSVKITAQEISHTYDNLFKTEPFKILTNDADRFLLILSNLLIAKTEFLKEFSNVEKEYKSQDDIILFLNTIQEKYAFFLIFIDEFEEVIKNENNIVVFILKSLKALLNGTSNIINETANPRLNHFLSFLIACTDAAFYEITRHDKLKYEYGGMRRRIREKYILGITLRESIEYLYKLNKFSYEGKHVESFINLGASFNAIARMAMNNAGYIKSFYWDLMSAAIDPNDTKSIIQIDGELLIETARGFKLEYMEADRKSISEEVYLNWLKKFRSKPLIASLIYLFLGEIKVFLLTELVNRFELDVTQADVLKGIRELNRYITSIHSNIRKSIIQVNLFKDETSPADIENILNYSDNPVEINESGEQIIRFSEGDVSFNQFLETISYFEITENGDIKEIYYFSTEKEILQDLFPYLDSETINILKLHFDNYLDKQKTEYYVINPNLFNSIFPLPIPIEYNIIKNKNINVALWTEISRTTKSEIFKNRICEVIANLLIQEKFITNSDNSKFKSEILKINSYDYFKSELDKNRFFILKNFMISDISKNPINIMFWREIGDYDDSIINDIISNVALFQKNELKNIHLVILFSQTKISDDLINILSENIEYSVIKQLSLSQFDITKYAFLDRVKDMKVEDFDTDRFKSAVEKIISPFKLILEGIKKKIEEKGLDIQLEKQMSSLSDIPQLLKYILYDFQSDFKNWKSVELKKPFDRINPIGLAPRYSSSIDDWSQDKLKSNIEDFLQANGFICIQKNSLKISMPKIEENILQLIKEFSKKSKNFTINDIKLFFFETTNSPALLEDVLLRDLGNRGIIEISSDKSISLVKRNDQLLRKRLKDIREKIKNLKINDKNFYHIYTFKKKGISLIFLQDFLDTLDLLIDLNITEGSEDTILTKQILFNRIFVIFEGIFNQIFLPLDIEISNFKIKFEREKRSKFNPDFINSKLEEFGFKNIKIEEFPELKELEQSFFEAVNKIEKPLNRGELRKKAVNYQKDHADEVGLKEQKFSYLKLQKYKLEKQFESPYLNLIYQDMLNKKELVLESNVYLKIKEIKETINEIGENYSTIQGSIAKVSLSGNLAPLIYEKIKKLSEFKFFETQRKATTLDQISKTLMNLKSEINKKIVEINFLLQRKRSDNQMNLIEKINFAEVSVDTVKSDIESIINFLLEKKIVDKEEDIEGYANTKEKLDISKYFDKIEQCDNLSDLQQIANNIYTILSSRTDTLNSIMERIKIIVINYFKEWRNINSLKKIFESLKYHNYASTCQKYLYQLKRFYTEKQDISFINICNDVLSLQTRIEQGYQRSVKEILGENQQEIFLELYDKYEKIGWFSESDLNELSNKFNLSQEEIAKLIDYLISHNLLEKAFSFK